jgi:hypothetical protein
MKSTTVVSDPCDSWRCVNQSGEVWANRCNYKKADPYYVGQTLKRPQRALSAVTGACGAHHCICPPKMFASLPMLPSQGCPKLFVRHLFSNTSLLWCPPLQQNNNCNFSNISLISWCCPSPRLSFTVIVMPGSCLSYMLIVLHHDFRIWSATAV